MIQRILLMLVLMILVTACGGGIPTQEATPTQVVIPTATDTPTPSPTSEPTLPAEFIAQFDGTEFAVAGGGLSYTAPGGETVAIPGQFSGEIFQFTLGDGTAVSADRDKLNVWNVIEDNHLVIKGDNGIPAYQFNEETKAWETVEQISMVDAFDNVVPGWVAEKSEVWEEKFSDVKILDRYRVSIGDGLPTYGLYSNALNYVNLKQWRLVEYQASEELRMQTLIMDFCFLNQRGEKITIKLQSADVDFINAYFKFESTQLLINSLTIGREYNLNPYFVSSSSTLTPLQRSNLYYQRVFKDISESLVFDIPCHTEEGCALDFGRMRQGHANAFFSEVVSGVYGNNIDLSADSWLLGWR
jgi:hypothetical protein